MMAVLERGEGYGLLPPGSAGTGYHLPSPPYLFHLTVSNSPPTTSRLLSLPPRISPTAHIYHFPIASRLPSPCSLSLFLTTISLLFLLLLFVRKSCKGRVNLSSFL
ncbi:hypothetical protein E2C01_065922 [Portunus trituberculatus]|uniref:Uncharacterized protein n=1 Tax=Portunus trituberculatus TaxID=210409 RepID=A0A5B7HSI3_PORTR|nr:hypothetical protein [Portunus trituberculatus]